ncbi:MAG: hypothetical protein KDH20_09770, partial [Rhodocyclaceae bacterium]|nr:hypothetical protein [Rhodocyclaceae bacterium]
MHRSRRHARQLFALRLLGVLALLLHLQASASMLGMAMGGDGQVICTAQGLVSVDALGQEAPTLSPHACCDLCGACTAPAIGGGARFDFGPVAEAPSARLTRPAAPRAPPRDH